MDDGSHDVNAPAPAPLRSPMPRRPHLDREEPELAHEDDIPSPEPAPPAPPQAPEHAPDRAADPGPGPPAPPPQEGVLTGLAKELGLVKPGA
jgi:hypothetical protein